jgi:hypothetical protein
MIMWQGRGDKRRHQLIFGTGELVDERSGWEHNCHHKELSSHGFLRWP